MVWIIALLCMALAGMTAYYRGPICAGFSLLGLFFGAVLARPLSPLTRHVVPLLGLHHPMWQLFMPQVLAFVLVVIIFKLVGNTLHQKMTLHFKYLRDERLFYRWERLYSRLGFCVGLVDGAVCFFILMLPIYVAGYFATEVAAADAPFSARLVTSLRAQLHDSHLDRVVAAYDPIPPVIYQAADIVDLVLHNPLLESRLSHYPALLGFGQQKEIQDISTDLTLQQMIQTQAKVLDIVNYPKIQALVTNATVAEQLHSLMGDDLNDLQEFLTTGKSPKYDGEKILGIWDIDIHATIAAERRTHLDMNRAQIAFLHTDLIPMIRGLSFLAATDGQLILNKENPNSALPTPVGQGTWKKTDTGYDVNLPGNKPDTIQVAPADDGTIQFQRGGRLLVFNKEM